VAQPDHSVDYCDGGSHYHISWCPHVSFTSISPDFSFLNAVP
jgi:hypothetical protein